MLSRFAVEIHTFTSQPGIFPKHPPFVGMLRPSFISQRQIEEPPNTWDTSCISGNVFAHTQTSSPAPYPQGLNSTWKTIEEPIHMSTAEKSGRPDRDQDLRCQSGPSAKDSVIFSGGDYSKNYGEDQQRLQISDPHFDKFSYVSNLCLLEDKVSRPRYVLVHNFLRKQCNGSKKWSWLIQWMN